MSDKPGTKPAGAARNETVIELVGDRELRRRTPLFDVLLTLALASIIASIGVGDPALLALGAPALAAIVWALAARTPIEGRVRVAIDEPHIVEGDSFDLVVEIEAGAVPVDRIEVELATTDHIEVSSPIRVVTGVADGDCQRFTFTARAARWGIGRVERVTVRVTDRGGLFGGHIDRSTQVAARIGLREDRAAASVHADRFRRVVGSHLSTDRGAGMELADVRPWLPGDSRRDINWRISNRRHEPWVTLRHPDRSSTVVVVVDAHDGNDAEQRDTQRRSVAAAMALTRGHLGLHDPIGLLVVGHTVRWVPPRLGRNQQHRIADELITVGDAPQASLRLYRPAAIHHISAETVVVAISPLRDPLMAEFLAELRSRGNPVAVLVPQTPPSQRRSAVRFEPRLDGLARRLSELEQRAGRHSLSGRGIVLVPWPHDEPVSAAITTIGQLRRSMRHGATR